MISPYLLSVLYLSGCAYSWTSYISINQTRTWVLIYISIMNCTVSSSFYYVGMHNVFKQLIAVNEMLSYFLTRNDRYILLARGGFQRSMTGVLVAFAASSTLHDWFSPRELQSVAWNYKRCSVFWLVLESGYVQLYTKWMLMEWEIILGDGDKLAYFSVF